MELLSVNVAEPRRVPFTDAPGQLTGIDKRPVDGPVALAAPGPKGVGGSGLAGDTIGDLRHHGGDDQAVYAFAREDLDGWAAELGRELPGGAFGENLTTRGLDVNGALVGERWRIGGDVLLEVNSARIPCRTFAGWLDERGWVKRFTDKAAPGAYLRVIEPGEVRAGDEIRDRAPAGPRSDGGLPLPGPDRPSRTALRAYLPPATRSTPRPVARPSGARAVDPRG